MRPLLDEEAALWQSELGWDFGEVRAAVAAGVDGLFMECHPDPKNAKSDAATMLGLDQVEPILRSCRQIADLRKGWE